MTDTNVTYVGPHDLTLALPHEQTTQTSSDDPPTPTAPITRTLTEYGVDLTRTPDGATITMTADGILVDQYVPGTDGQLLTHEGPDGAPISPVIVRRFYPHPTRPARSAPSTRVRGGCA